MGHCFDKIYSLFPLYWVARNAKAGERDGRIYDCSSHCEPSMGHVGCDKVDPERKISGGAGEDIPGTGQAADEALCGVLSPIGRHFSEAAGKEGEFPDRRN
jgi:hypothetical protein